MSTILDCKTLACPQPVILTKKLIESEHPESLTVIVDNEPARENVSRLLSQNGYSVEVTSADGTIFTLAAKRTGTVAASSTPEAKPSRHGEFEKVAVVVAAEVFGSGDNALGQKLMLNFLKTLPEFGESLWRLILLNGGVKLSAKNSPVLTELEAIQSMGTQILVCGTCLEHFGLLQEKAVGETTNMLDVVTSMQLADKVIKI